MSRRLQLIALEDRTCPTVAFTLTGRTLYALGDAAADRIQVTELTDGAVRASANGSAPVDSTDVDRVVVRAGDGDNFVQVAGNGRLKAVVVETLTGRDDVEVAVPAADHRTTVAVSSGAGDDDVLVTLEGRSPAAGAIAVNLKSGDGDDHATFGSTGVLHASVDGRFDLGAGDDALTAAFPGFDGNPSFHMSAKCGDGNDEVQTTLGGPATSRLAAVGIVVVGGFGDDGAIIVQNNLNIGGGPAASRLAAVGFVIVGGFGDDRAIIVQNNVHVAGGWTATVDLGAGINSATLEAHSTTVAGRTRVSVTGGPGDDVAALLLADANDFQGPTAVRLALGGGNNAGTVMVADVNEFQA